MVLWMLLWNTQCTDLSWLNCFFIRMSPLTRCLTLHFSFLNVDKHSAWMDSLLEFVQDAMQIDADEDESGNRKVDYTGYVLALNGHKRYLCLFKPVYTGEDPDKSEEEGAAPGARSRSSSREEHQHQSRKGTTRLRSTTLQIHHKLDRLGLWTERLLEGTLPRYYIPAWPGLDKITVSKT